MMFHAVCNSVDENENILQRLKSESAPCIKLCLSKERVDSESLKGVFFKTNPCLTLT